MGPGSSSPLKNFASTQGKDWTDYDTQIDFLNKEARERVPAWPSQQGLGSAGAISHAYEGYGDNSTGTRIGNSSKFFQMHHGSHAAPGLWHAGGTPTGPIIPAPLPHDPFDPSFFENWKRMRASKDYYDPSMNGPPKAPDRYALLDYGIPNMGARLSSLAAANPVTTSSTSNAVHIGKIDVDARGGDSQDIANNLHAALQRSTSTLLTLKWPSLIASGAIGDFAIGISAIGEIAAGTSSSPITLLTSDLIGEIAPNGALWGIFQGGAPVVTCDSVQDMSYRQEWAISDFATEEGAFQSFDKVFLPFDVRLRFNAGSAAQRQQAMLNRLRRLRERQISMTL